MIKLIIKCKQFLNFFATIVWRQSRSAMVQEFTGRPWRHHIRVNRFSYAL